MARNELVERDSEPESGLPEIITGSEFAESFGESLSQTLNLDTWTPGEELSRLYSRLEQEVAEAVSRESEMRKAIREKVFPQIKRRPNAPEGAGVYQASQQDIERVHRSILFNGALEACDGNSNVHDTLPLTITQLGVSLVSYSGEQGSWVHRLFRRDLRTRGQDPVDEALMVLERRSERGGIGIDDRSSHLSDLARRGIMAYAERSVLLNKSDCPWRMGHGSPAAYELLTGSGSMALLTQSLEVLEELLGKHKRFVFVPSSPRERVLLTIGEALRVLEYAIVDTAYERMRKIVENGHYAQKYKLKAMEFVNTIGPDVVSGVYRASRVSPAYVFYAHREYAHEAALIAMADSTLQEHRGFPMLIDLADTVCRSALGLEGFAPSIETAYIDAGAPFRYQGERSTRKM
jgi:hypothetical protein